jgi:hypothetical protein
VSEMLDRIARAIDPSAFAEHDGAGTYNWAGRRRVARMRACRAVGALMDPDHDATASVVPVGEDRRPAVAVFNAILIEILK